MKKTERLYVELDLASIVGSKENLVDTAPWLSRLGYAMFQSTDTQQRSLASLALSEDAQDKAEYVNLIEQNEPSVKVLADIISTNGQLEPIRVTRTEEKDKYDLTFGIRQVLARLYTHAKTAGTIPARLAAEVVEEDTKEALHTSASANLGAGRNPSECRIVIHAVTLDDGAAGVNPRPRWRFVTAEGERRAARIEELVARKGAELEKRELAELFDPETWEWKVDFEIELMVRDYKWKLMVEDYERKLRSRDPVGLLGEEGLREIEDRLSDYERELWKMYVEFDEEFDTLEVDFEIESMVEDYERELRSRDPVELLGEEGLRAMCRREIEDRLSDYGGVLFAMGDEELFDAELDKLPDFF